MTTPGPPARRSLHYRDTIALALPTQEIAITTRLRRLEPIIAALQPDLIVSASFPYRILLEIVAIPRLGAVNLHPSLLPRYRGPNPARQIYDGKAITGATPHQITPEFGAGPILCQQERTIPADATVEAVWSVWREVVAATVEDGLERAMAGDPGTPQDRSQATHAATFTEEECWLNWRESPSLLQRRVTGLQMFGLPVYAGIEGQTYSIKRSTPLPRNG